MKKLLILAMVLMLSFSGSAQESNDLELDFTDGQTFGDSYIDSGTIVTPPNSSGTYISNVIKKGEYNVNSVTVVANFYSNNSSSNMTVETSVNEFETIRSAIGKELKEGEISYDLEELNKEDSYRIVIESEDAVDIDSITINRDRVGRKLIDGNYPLIGELEYSFVTPTIPYAPQAIAAVVVFGFFSITTYWRRIQNQIRIKKLRKKLDSYED